MTKRVLSIWDVWLQVAVAIAIHWVDDVWSLRDVAARLGVVVPLGLSLVAAWRVSAANMGWIK